MSTEKRKTAGRPPRSKSTKRHFLGIKVTTEEKAVVKKLAEKYDGNINKLFRVKILGEDESK